MTMDDHYAVLGVNRDASADEIKRAFRRLALELHPDRFPDDPDAQERFMRVSAAYDTLSNSASRARYDAKTRLTGGLDLSKGFDGKVARDLLGNVFGDVFRSRRSLRRRGRDLRYTLSVDLVGAIMGSSHTIEFDAFGPCTGCEGSGTAKNGRAAETCPSCRGRGEIKGDGLLAGWTRCGRCDGTGLVQVDPCATCRGRGATRGQRSFEVRVPAGTESGAERRVVGQGEPGRFGGDPGDLRVTVNVRPHPWLERRGQDIASACWVSLTEASLGASVPVLTVDGMVEVEVPAGVKHGTRLRLRGRGVPRPPSARRAKEPARGDHFATVLIETPQHIGAELRASLEALERAALAQPDALPLRAAQRRAFERGVSSSDDARGRGDDRQREGDETPESS